ncbi:MAG TPA: phosphopantothenoylcysteine decarboxylase, partial [Phenylobacterium sp.]|nr:phosphopantothenoylcysteine decarboxylase [Phenylobacterium sp.]
AEALAALGCEVPLVSGPTALRAPAGVRRVHVETARQMLAACQAALPADLAVCVAAVADWRPAQEGAVKIKKGTDGPPPIALVENPDILATLSAPGPGRPRLVVGFAAETNDVEAYAQAKLKRKGCDWIVANDVSIEGTMGGDDNAVSIVTGQGVERWDRTAKSEVAARLAARMAQELS